MLSPLCLLAAALAATASAQYATTVYAAGQPVALPVQPVVVPASTVYAPWPPTVYSVEEPSYSYKPSADLQRIFDASKAQSAYAAEKLAADVEAATNFNLKDTPGLNYQYNGPNYNDIAVRFGGAKYLDPATYTFQYRPEDQYKYDIENPKPFKYKYNPSSDANNDNSYY